MGQVLTKVNNVVNINESPNAKEISLWAVVTANDSEGLIIDGIKKGDRVIIESANGIASFKETNMKFLKSIITITQAITEAGAAIYTEGQSTKFHDEFTASFDAIKEIVPNKITHARRDAWGEDPGTNDYAKHEGGLIVCMPSAHGAIYATEDNYLADGAKKNGRQTKYFSKNIKNLNSFFPCNCSGGTREGVAKTEGSINILAFDSKFNDNAGYYEFKLKIIRN